MKKMIPVYILQLAMLATFVFLSLQLLREVHAMKVEITNIRREQVKASIAPIGTAGSVVQVEVVNRKPLDVAISH